MYFLPNSGSTALYINIQYAEMESDTCLVRWADGFMTVHVGEDWMEVKSTASRNTFLHRQEAKDILVEHNRIDQHLSISIRCEKQRPVHTCGSNRRLGRPRWTQRLREQAGLI